jgi:putative ATPase
MGDLFSDAATAASEVAPLAQRLRPATLGEFVGQQHVLGEGSALRRAIEEDRVHSAIFYGRPGAGRRRSRGSSLRRPARRSRSCRPSRRR